VQSKTEQNKNETIRIEFLGALVLVLGTVLFPGYTAPIHDPLHM